MILRYSPKWLKWKIQKRLTHVEIMLDIFIKFDIMYRAFFLALIQQTSLGINTVSYDLCKCAFLRPHHYPTVDRRFQL